MMNLRAMGATLSCLLAIHCSKRTPSAPAADAAPPYALEGTEVRSLHAQRLQRDYQIYVSLPASYGQGTRRYPVLFVTDAAYAFPVARSIARRVGNHGKDLEEFILIGLSYATGDTPEFSRRRDYTPTPHGEAGAVSDMPGRAPVFGGAEEYRRFLAEELFPFVAKHYRVDMDRKVFAGHSYGSLLGAHILLTEPRMFRQYILSSPSLWFDHRVMFQRETDYARGHGDLPAEVFMAVGAFETVGPGPRYNKQMDLVGDMQAFERALRSRKYPGLHVQSTVLPDEDHLTVAPGILTRGLVWAFGLRR